VTGFLIDPPVFFRSIIDNFPLVSGVIGALVAGKWVAAQVAGRAFAYTCPARLTMWSLVAFDTFDPSGQRLIDVRLLNVVLVLMLTRAILGPILTERFAPRMLEEEARIEPGQFRDARA